MPWIVKLDKEQDFIGRWALEHVAGRRAETALVGFTVADGEVPTEGAVVLADGEGPAGQVTSARFSPQLGAGDRDGVGAVRAGRGRRADLRSPTTAGASRPRS